jgi:hypothetical protein
MQARGEVNPQMQLWQLPMSGLLPTDGLIARNLSAQMENIVEIPAVLMFQCSIACPHPTMPMRGQASSSSRMAHLPMAGR